MNSNILLGIDEEYDSSYSSPITEVINCIYQKSIPLIKSIAKRYVNLTDVNEEEDFLQEGYLAVVNALQNYNRENGCKFSTYLTWQIQKCFERLCPSEEMMVEIRRNGDRPIVVSYKHFQKIKKTLPMDAEWTILRKNIPFDSFTNTEVLKNPLYRGEEGLL